jgi:hypothetical protein
MRYTILKNGIQERINYLVGTNDLDTDPESVVGELNHWSAQASMITNIRRIVKGIVGNSTNGKVMSGLQISQSGSTSNILITGGIGFTVAGNIIVINPSSISKSLGTPALQDYPIYLMYEESFAPMDSSTIEYHSSQIMGTSTTPINILADDTCSNTNDTAIIADKIQITTQDLSVNDGLYLGKVTVTNLDPIEMIITPPTSSGQYVGNFKGSLSGFSAGGTGVAYDNINNAVTATINYEVSGKKCTFFIPPLWGTSNSSLHILTGMPSGIILSEINSTPIPIFSDTDLGTGVFSMNTTQWVLTTLESWLFTSGHSEGIGYYPCTIVCYLP